MKQLLFIGSLIGLLFIVGCGDKRKSISDQNPLIEDSTDSTAKLVGEETNPLIKQEVKDSLGTVTGETHTMESVSKDAGKVGEVIDSTKKVVKGDAKEIIEAPKHGSPDTEEIKRMKKEKNKGKMKIEGR